MVRPLVALRVVPAAAHGAPHMLELGAARIEAGEIADSFEALARPEVPVESADVPADALARAEPAADVIERFLGWAGDAWTACHDAPSAAHTLACELLRAGRELPATPWLDVRRLALELLPEAAAAGALELHELVDLLELEDGPRGRALADATWTWKVLEECLRRAGANDPADLLSRAGPPVTVAGAAPRPPLRKQAHRAIQRACERGATLTLVYGSEDEPPVPLVVRPRLVYTERERAYLEAECVQSGTLKTYRLDRVHRARPVRDGADPWELPT